MFNRFKEETKQPDVGSFSELDLQLRADKDGSLGKKILKQLEDYLTHVKMKLTAGGLKPNDYELAEKVTKGLEDAKKIIEKTSSAPKS